MTITRSEGMVSTTRPFSIWSISTTWSFIRRNLRTVKKAAAGIGRTSPHLYQCRNGLDSVHPVFEEAQAVRPVQLLASSLRQPTDLTLSGETSPNV
ncbi:MAG: hypothetical protein JO020_04625 [Chloroflexi bacterium]|nr:hypothetical protein [Chloroflexota bacterium]